MHGAAGPAKVTAGLILFRKGGTIHPSKETNMPPQPTHDLIRIAKEYLAALERGVPFEELARFFTPDCVQEEFPNRLVPNGARRTLEDLKAAAGRGAKAVENQRYEVLNAFTQDNQVALEIRWSARLLLPFGSSVPGDVMKARFAVFLVFREDRIQSQHNYDCFDPF
jgi:ketosteroid isomerase-like protein